MVQLIDGMGVQALDLGPVHVNCHSGYAMWKTRVIENNRIRHLDTKQCPFVRTGMPTPWVCGCM